MELTQDILQYLARVTPGNAAIYRLNGERIETLYVSPSLFALNGLTEAEYLARTRESASAIVLSADLPGLMAAVRACVTSRVQLDCYYRVYHKTRGTDWVHANARVCGTKDGLPVLLVVYANASLELDIYNNLLDHSNRKIYVVDAATHELLYENRLAAAGDDASAHFSSRADAAALSCEEHPDCACCWTRCDAARGVWERISRERIRWCERDAFVYYLDDITESEKKNAELRGILAAEEKLVDMTQLLQGPGTLAERLSGVLRCMGEFFSADRAYIFELEADGKFGNNTYEWCREGVEPQIDFLQHVDAQYIARWMPYFSAHRAVVVPDIEQIRLAQPNEYDIMSHQNIHSYLEAPIEMGGAFAGFIGVDNPSASLAEHAGDMLLSLAYSVSGAMLRAQSEQSLWDTQRQYQLAVRGAGLAVWEYDVRAHVIQSTGDSLMASGAPSRIENVPQSMLSYFDPQDVPALQQMYRDIEAGADRAQGEFWATWQPGAAPRCEKITYLVVKDAQGRPVKAYGLGQDVTVQKLEQRKFRRDLRDLLGANPHALCTFRLNLTTNWCGDEYGTSGYIQSLLHGSTADELFDRIASIITDADDAVLFRRQFSRTQLLQDFAAGKSEVTLSYHRLVENGESHWVTTHLSMLRHPDTGEVEAVAYSLDTDREKKEDEVIAAITNREYDHIALVDVGTRQVHFHYTSERLPASSCPRIGHYSEVVRDVLASGVALEDMESCARAVAFERVLAALETDSEYSYSFSCRDARGREYRKQLSYRYLNDKKREILLMRTDVTEAFRQEQAQARELRAALAEARRASQLKTEFLSNVSHDMRTPLNAVLGYTRLAADAAQPDEVRAYLDKIRQAGDILLTLINDTLDLSKIETGAVALKLAPVLGSEVIAKVVSAVRPVTDEKHLRLVVDMSRAAMVPIRADELRLQEIFMNLLSNSIKFTPAGGSIYFTAECQKCTADRVWDRIVVRDTGDGISEEFLPRVFEPFTQENAAESAGVGGSGLGLSIVKRLVEMMGGTIEVRSSKGSGAEFVMLLSFARADGDARPSAAPAVSARARSLAGTHVLLCEDNAMNTEIARKLLAARGVAVTCAANGLEGVQTFLAAAPGSFDAVLMDLRMPVMNGYDAAARIRACARADAGVPIIAMSADAYEDDVQRSMAAGMDAHLAKPVDPELLFAALQAQLGKKG